MAKNNEGYTHLPRAIHRPTTLNPLIQRPQQLNYYYFHYYWMVQQTNGHGQQKTQPLLTQDIVALQNIKGQTHDLLSSTSFHHYTTSRQQLKLLLVGKVLKKSINFLVLLKYLVLKLIDLKIHTYSNNHPDCMVALIYFRTLRK